MRNPEELFYNSVVVDLETTGPMQGKPDPPDLCHKAHTQRTRSFQPLYLRRGKPSLPHKPYRPESLKNCPTEREVLKSSGLLSKTGISLSPITHAFEMHFLEERSELHQLPHGNHAYICLMETFSDFFSTGWKKLPVAVRRCLEYKTL
jgi:hypothetical protein